jgi:flavin reductase (DIM6/NTAB) family NADH-FMN oxidoreductase RutF
MFYQPEKESHGLPHSPLKACVAPRPIGWISSLDSDGKANLAPYSFFQMLNDRPPVVIFSSIGKKDSQNNIEVSGEFVYSMVPKSLTDAMNATSINAPSDVDEFEFAGLTKAACNLVSAPRVAESPIAFECKVHQILDVPNSHPGMKVTAIVGLVVGVHIDDNVLIDGIIDTNKIQPLARLGYMEYAAAENVFTLNRPIWKD